MLQLNAVSKSYNGQPVIDAVHLRLPPGATTVLIGPSGCGKSTLLRLMIGLVTADSGSINFGGKPLGPDTVQGLRQRIGYVIQSGGLFPHLTAADNTTLMARHLRWPQQKVLARCEQLAELVRLPPDCLGRLPGALSGGQQQRVSLMRALMLDPEVLLLDEPLAALDPMIRAELQADLREIFAGLGKTVCWVTHDLAEAAWFSERIVLLRSGAIEQIGSLQQLRAEPANEFVERFVNAQRQLAGQA